MNKQERLRRSYLPSKVRILFVGESPPASGRFFYEQNSGLYRAIRDAFHTAYPHIEDEKFLSFFQETGCYLIDLCRVPVDRLERKSRRQVCLQNEEYLARRIRALNPEMIITVVRSIRLNVDAAIQRVNWKGEIVDLPYPGRWVQNRKVFVRVLARRLRKLDGTIDPL